MAEGSLSEKPEELESGEDVAFEQQEAGADTDAAQVELPTDTEQTTSTVE